MLSLENGLGFDAKTVQRKAGCWSRRTLSNEYFVFSVYYLRAKFGFDTADNELVKFARSPRTDPPGDEF